MIDGWFPDAQSLSVSVLAFVTSFLLYLSHSGWQWNTVKSTATSSYETQWMVYEYSDRSSGHSAHADTGMA
jgi:hypothetical protein